MQPTLQTSTMGEVEFLEVHKSFDDFYRASYPNVTRALVVALGSVDGGTEAADEAMTRTYRKWDEVSGFDNPEGWCFRVGLNYGRSKLRRVIRRRPRSSQQVDTEAWVESSLPNPELWAALQGLERQQRDVVVCRALLELSVRETSEFLKIPEGTVKSRFSHAKTNLRKVLDHE